MADDNLYYEERYTSLQLIMASVSIVAGLCTLWILWDQNKWTGFLYLVGTLSVAQMTYDVGFYFRANGTEDPLCELAWYFLQCGGGMATTLMTNVIAWIVMTIALTLRSYDIKKNYFSIMCWVIGVSLIMTVVLCLSAMLEPHDEYQTLYSTTVFVYASFRVLSILFNFVAYLVLTLRLRRMGLSLNSNKNQPLHPVAALSSRMIYYPIVQVLTRCAAAWMEFGYPPSGPGNDDVPSDTVKSTSYQVANFLYAVSGPSAGVGFFLIFLFMQPAAFSHLKAKICCQFGEPNTPAQSLKADILRESHSVCIAEIDASSDDTPSHSVDTDQSPMVRTMAMGGGNTNNGRVYSQEERSANMHMQNYQSGRHKSQGGTPTNANGFARHFSADGQGGYDARQMNASGDGNGNSRFVSHDFYSSGNNSSSVAQSGHSFDPSKLALLDDDELAGLVEKLAAITQQTDEVRNSLAENSYEGSTDSSQAIN